MPFLEFVICKPEIAAGKHLFPVTVVFECSRFALKLVNHMSVIDQMPLFAAQARQRIYAFLSIEKIEMLGKELDLYGFADQPAFHRVDVVIDTDGAALANADRQALAAFNVLIRKGA